MNDDTNQRAREVVEAVEWQMDNCLPAKGEDWMDCYRRRMREEVANAITSAREEALREAAEKLEERAIERDQHPVQFGGYAKAEANEARQCAWIVRSRITGGGERTR